MQNMNKSYRKSVKLTLYGKGLKLETICTYYCPLSNQEGNVIFSQKLLLLVAI